MSHAVIRSRPAMEDNRTICQVGEKVANKCKLSDQMWLSQCLSLVLCRNGLVLALIHSFNSLDLIKVNILNNLRANNSIMAYLLQYRHRGRQRQQASDTTGRMGEGERWLQMIYSMLCSRTEEFFTLQVWPALWLRTSPDTPRFSSWGSRIFLLCPHPWVGGRHWPCPSDQSLDKDTG